MMDVNKDLKRFQITRDVIAEYLREVNKISQQKSWEESQVLSGLWTWLSEQEDDE